MDIKTTTPPLGVNSPPVSIKADNKAEAAVITPVSQAVKNGNSDQKANGLNKAIGDATTAPKKDQLEQAVANVNKLFQAEHRKLSFTINEATKGVVIQVKDSETDEVIRQIPPEFVVKLAEQLQEKAQEADGALGIFLKDKA